MPYYNDVPYYYGGSYANHSSLMTGTGRPFTPLSRFSPHLSTISESPLNHLHRYSAISMRHPRRVIDTADIDVSSPRILSHDGNRPRNRLRRDRPTIKIRSQALKDNPTLREHYERHEKSVGELLMEKFFIRDKKADEGEDQQVRLHHQIELDRDEGDAQEQEATQERKQITRRFTRRRSSADLQLDPEQLQREATYAQVQAKVLDSLVAEEQAEIESEARRGTLIRKGTVRGPTTVHSYYAHNTDSDTMTREEEEAAALRMRKAMKKAKKKKKSTDKPSPPDKAASDLDNRRSSTSSEMSTDSKLEEEREERKEEEEEEEEEEKEEEEENGPRPHMYKIEACNSAGDFSTIWMNASENEKKRKLDVEQYRESVRIPVPRKFEAKGETGGALPEGTDEAETRVVLPVRKPYVKDASRNSAYLTVKKPVEKLGAKDDEGERLANGFVDVRSEFLKNNTSETSEDSPRGLKGKVQAADSNVKDIASKKTAGKSEKTQSTAKNKDIHCASRSLLDNADSPRDVVISKIKSETVEAATKGAPSPRNIETAVSSARTTADASAFVSANERIEQSQLSKDNRIVVGAKRNESEKNDIVAIGATRKSVEVAPPAIKTRPEASVAEDIVGSRVDKIVDEEEKEEGAVGAPKIPTMSRVNVTTRRSVVSIAGGTVSENSASISAMPTPMSATCLPKPSKINADRNNAVEAPELSLREAAYLANSSKRECAEDVALPGKKADKVPNLARNAPSLDATKKASGVDAEKSLLERDGTRDDAAKSKTGDVTLLGSTNDEVRNKDRDSLAGSATDSEPTKGIDLTGTPLTRNDHVSRELSSGTSISSKIDDAIVTGASTNVPKEANLPKPLKTDLKKISAIDLKKDTSRDSGLLSPKNKVPKIGESKFPFKVKTFSKTIANETGATDSSKIGKDPNASKTIGKDGGKTTPAPRRDANAPRILKKSVSVDSSKLTNNCSSNTASSDVNIPKVPQKFVSVDGKTKGKSMPVKKTSEATAKFPSKVTEKKPVIADASCEKSPGDGGQLSKSASTESIDFWSEIKAPGSPKATRTKQQDRIPREATVIPKNEEKAEPTNPKWISSDSPSGKSSTAPVKELDDKKNETDVKISVAPGSPAVGSGDVAEEKKEKVVPESPKAKAEAAEPAANAEIEKKSLTQKAPRKKKNLSIAIGIKDANSTVKKAPSKREDYANSVSRSDPGTPDTATPASEVSTPMPEAITVPAINIVEAPGLPGSESQSGIDEEYEDPRTPTNELPDHSFTSSKISKWNNRDDLTNADDTETPIPSEEASVATSPTVSPQTSKTKRAIKKKKKQTSSTKKTPSTKSEKETKEAGRETSSSQQNSLAVKSTEQRPLAKPSPKTSPRSSPRNLPSQRPLDLIRMFYTTPSALLTATPRDLSKVKRAKIKRRRHYSRTPSVSSDSTGSTTSTATIESTDGSGSTCTELDDDHEHKRMNSTRSNDSGFDGSPRISNCDMACHKKCEKLTGNLCGLNQKLVAEALQALKRAPSQSSDNQRNSDSSDHFSSGRITPPATNLPKFKKYTVTDFNFLKVLGKGSFGKVLLAELRGTECVYAVKCLKKDVVLEDDDVECTLIERKVLTLATRHPYLCHLFCTFQTESHLFFVMEYLNGGDLMFHIQKSGRFPEVRARFYAAEIWSGLNFLHKKGIVYRDLKLDNVLLDFDGHIRIADFGMCKLQIFLDRTADTFCGTPDYMAPEIIKGLKYNQAVDWWSYGVLLYEMLTGQSPFSGCDEDELFWSICNERPFIPRYLSQEATDILICLLEKDSGKRPPGHEIAMHTFFQNLPWDRLERRQLEAPFKPALDHTLDTKYFDTAFTTERPRLTPVPEQILTSMDQGVFRGFSYTNPNATD